MSREEAVKDLARLLAEDELFFQALERAVDSFYAEHPEARPEVRAVLARIAERSDQR